MAPEILFARTAVLVGIGLLGAALFAAWSARNMARRVVAIAVVFLAALLALAALGAPQALVLAAACAMFAYVALGVTLLVRAQESYGKLDSGLWDEGDSETERVQEDEP